MLIDDQFLAPLSQAIQKEYNKLISILLDIEPGYRVIKTIDGTGGKVTVSDVIAYQIGWGNLLINWYEAGLKGKMPQMPGEGFTKWDYVGLAKHFYQKYQYDGHKKQEQEFRKIVKKVVNIAEHEYQSGNLDKKGVWAWCTLPSGKQWPLSKWIIVNTAAPYKRAAILIRKFIKVVDGGEFL